MFFNIVLTIVLLSQNITWIEAASSEYILGENTIYKDVEFEAVIENGINIEIEAEDAVMDFGMISKHSTGKFLAETKIEAKGAPVGSEITAKFVEGPQSTQELKLESDNYTKIILKREVNEEIKKVENSKDKYLTEEVEEVEVFLERINDKKYRFEDNLSEAKATIPIKGEIRSLDKVKIGNYGGEVSVYLELVTPNTEVIN